MKQQLTPHSSGSFVAFISLPAVIISSLFLLGLHSCKSKSKGVTLTTEDSTKIFMARLEMKEKIYYQHLSASNLEKLFTPKDAGADPNAVKQLHFTWYEADYNSYALKAYGADEKGNRMNDDIALDIPDKSSYIENINDLNQELLVVIRGDLKYLFRSSEAGRNAPIKSGEYKDLSFIPEYRAYSPDYESLFFSIKESGTGESALLLRTSVIYANPSPPYNRACAEDCDD